MKKIIFILSICVLNFLFSQDSVDPRILNDLKISVYDNQNNKLDSLGIYISENKSDGTYTLCIDVILEQRKNNFSGLGFAFDEVSLERWYRSLRDAQKEFQMQSNKNIIQKNIKIGGHNPVEIYKWESEHRNGPTNRINYKKKSKSYPLSIELVSQKNQQELWIYTNGQSSNPKAIAMLFNSFDSFNSFVNSINPASITKQYRNHFTVKKRKK